MVRAVLQSARAPCSEGISYVDRDCTHMSTYKHWGDERIETGVVGPRYKAEVTRQCFVHAANLSTTCATLRCPRKNDDTDAIARFHTPPGAGGMLNVTDFGAVGDGKTDCSGAIVDVLNNECRACSRANAARVCTMVGNTGKWSPPAGFQKEDKPIKIKTDDDAPIIKKIGVQSPAADQVCSTAGPASMQHSTARLAGGSSISSTTIEGAADASAAAVTCATK